MDRNEDDRQQAIRIQLTEEQRRQVQQATGKNAQAIALSAHELEERISPALRIKGS